MTINDYRKASSHSQNSTVWFLVLASIALIGILLGVRIFVDYKRTINSVEARQMAQARMVDENLDANLTVANLMLNNASKEFERITGNNNNQLNKYLQAQEEMIPGIRTIMVIDAQGRCIYSNRDAVIGKDLSYRDYFKAPRDASDKNQLFISPPFKTILGNFVINISKPIIGKQGEFKGIATLALEPEYFSTLLNSTIYAPDNRISLLHSDGTVFISMSEDKHVITGKNLLYPGSQLFQHLNARTSTSIQRGISNATADNRVVTFITNSPKDLRLDKHILVAASRNMDAVLSSWRTDTGIQLVIYILLISVAMFITRAMLLRRDELSRMHVTQASILSSAGEGIIGLNQSGTISFCNNAAELLTGWNHQELLGRDFHRSFHPMHGDDYGHPMVKCPVCLTLQDGTARNVTDDTFVNQKSMPFPVEYTVTPLIEQKMVVGGVVVFRDISERKRLEEVLQQQAQTDQLTGANNRGHFLELLEIEIERAHRYGRTFCVMMLDLDRFKSVNDTRGHAAGDEALRTMTRVLQLSGLRQSDFWGRIGGEEFAVVLPETELHHAAEAAERIRANLAETPVTYAAENFQITVSIGVSEYRIGDVQDTLLNRADKAMYEAKLAGRNKVCLTS